MGSIHRLFALYILILRAEWHNCVRRLVGLVDDLALDSHAAFDSEKRWDGMGLWRKEE
jgi:hypothetical protein